MNDSTRSNTGLGVPHMSGEDAFHPQLDGYTLVMTGPLPPFLRGGFGRVYRALNSDGALMAVKVPHPSTLNAPTLQRWSDECRLSLALPPHEHVVTFFGRTTARWPDGRESPALVMEWLEGARPLISYADAVGLDKPQRVELLMQAIEGVAWMHEHATPHCDLKSTNMLVIDRGRRAVVKITDFGGTRGRSGMDPRPAVFSPHRVAPEVLAGDPAAIDARADVFALGKELTELVAGPDATRAPEGDHRAWQPCPVRAQLGLDDPALDAIIVKATQAEPSQRFANAVEMLEALRQYAPPLSERSVGPIARRAPYWC
jgi:eukaryotic-like serine/threonine-protein kinase